MASLVLLSGMKLHVDLSAVGLFIPATRTAAGRAECSDDERVLDESAGHAGGVYGVECGCWMTNDRTRSPAGTPSRSNSSRAGETGLRLLDGVLDGPCGPPGLWLQHTLQQGAGGTFHAA